MEEKFHLDISSRIGKKKIKVSNGVKISSKIITIGLKIGEYFPDRNELTEALPYRGNFFLLRLNATKRIESR